MASNVDSRFLKVDENSPDRRLFNDDVTDVLSSDDDTKEEDSKTERLWTTTAAAVGISSVRCGLDTGPEVNAVVGFRP